MLRKILLVVVLSFACVAPAVAGTAGEAAQAGRFERYYGLLPDADAQKRISDIGQQLVRANGLEAGGFTFKVLNSAEVNAVTLPGGYIYVYKGLLDFMPTDDEVAAVVGHEIGHVTGRHMARREREQLLSMLLGAVLGGVEGAVAMNAALASLPAYNQRDERDADDRGFGYVVGARRNPYAVLVVMHKLQDADEHPEIKINFAQHPEPAVRAERIKRYIQRLQVTPIVLAEGDSGARVEDGGWSFAIRAPEGANKPLYRAWLLAGNLHILAQAKDLSPEGFIVQEQKDSAAIYFGDQLVYSISREDVLRGGQTFAQAAADCVERLRAWALLRAGRPVPATT